MRKLVVSGILLCLAMSICSGCKKESLPMPEYPLDKPTVEAVLEDAGLLWDITNEELWGEGRVFYELCDKEGKAIAVISSVGDGSTRVLQLTFFSLTAITTPLPREDWEKSVNLATILYGGFEAKGQVFETFQNTYKEMALVDSLPNSVPKDKQRIRWRNEINGVECFIGLSRWDGSSDTPTTEMVSIILSSDIINFNESESSDIQAYEGSDAY